MNDMTAALLLISLIACVYALYKTWSRSSAFKNGLDYANKILNGSDEEKSLGRCIEYVTNSREYGDFDSGVKKAIADKIARSVAEKNAQHGGNWYFCRINKKYRNREQ